MPASVVIRGGLRGIACWWGNADGRSSAMTDATVSHGAARQPRQFFAALSSRQFLLLLINVVIFLVLTALRPDAFPSWTNLKAVLSLMSYDLLIAIAMTIVLIVRGIDLSVGSVIALSSVTMALLMRAGMPVVPVVARGTDRGAALRADQRRCSSRSSESCRSSSPLE